MFERTLEVADEEPSHTEHGVDSGDVAHRRLKIDVLKWRAGKLRPKVYGDKIQQEHTGADGKGLTFTVITGVPAPDGSAS